MKTEKETLVELVKAEAKKLKANALKKELANLDFEELDSEKREHCIYGQVTGDCFSLRALELIRECCNKMYATKDWIKNSKLNGNLPPDVDESRFYNGINYFSPIEFFINIPANKKHNNKILINYLKGERKTLTFKPF